MPGDANYLLNPLHPDFKRIRVGRPSLLVTDIRLIERLGNPSPPGTGGRTTATHTTR